MRTVLLLVGSNCFMTAAWYGHLRYKSRALWVVILTSWLIALPEYMLQVPANRFGHGTFTAPQLKIIQEAISITVFIAFCLAYLKEPIRWNYAVSFVLMLAAVAVAMLDKPGLIR
ncbi:MAG TPA: DMT family protein [Elusimicrobiota bacterium]|jgi:uncharacterized protein (DUF486 family)|nr:DMT family protein [Elusimicrobiota bacterium]